MGLHFVQRFRIWPWTYAGLSHKISQKAKKKYIQHKWSDTASSFAPVKQKKVFFKVYKEFQPSHFQDYCLLYNSYNVSLENLVLDHLIIPQLIFFLFSSLVCWMLYCKCKSVLVALSVKEFKFIKYLWLLFLRLKWDCIFYNKMNKPWPNYDLSSS